MKILEMFNNSRKKFVSSFHDWESDAKSMSEASSPREGSPRDKDQHFVDGERI